MLVSAGKKNTEQVKWYLEGSSGGGQKYIIPLDKSPFLVGRQKDCHLILDSREVSRKHAKITARGEYLYLSDLNSTNGTYKNKSRIQAEVLIEQGDIIHFGSIKFNVFTAEAKERTVSHTQCQSDGTAEESFAGYYNISKREKEILFLLLEGKSTKEIADKLCIAEGTAKNHVLKIFKKTKAHSRVSLVNAFNEFSANR